MFGDTQPPAGSGVQQILMELRDSRSVVKPRTSEDLPKNGARAMFCHPPVAYAFVAMLYDGTVCHVTTNGRAWIVTAIRTPKTVKL
jgi:hypothetical protein